jgi:tetratricopeptide (TPR) repeat protein
LKTLGAYGADLAALAGLFDQPWTKLVATLAETDQGWILNDAAVDLRALGRLREALAPMRAGLEPDVRRGEWSGAAQSANNLSELHLALGDVAEAVTLGEACVVYADRSGNGFHRVDKRTALADALHQAGDAVRAQALLEEAESLQAEIQPDYPRLYSIPSYR